MILYRLTFLTNKNNNNSNLMIPKVSIYRDKGEKSKLHIWIIRQ